MISGDLNPGDNVFIASFLGIGELLWMFSILIFFLNFQTRRKPTTLFTPQKNLSPLIQSKRRALALADKSGNETHKEPHGQ